MVKKSKYGRADLISPDGQVWDVKRDKARQIRKGQEQVRKYVSNIWKGHSGTELSVGGDDIASDSFYYKSGLTTYKVTYRNAGGGVIAYDYRFHDYDYQEAANIAIVTVATAFVTLLAGLFGIPAPSY